MYKLSDDQKRLLKRLTQKANRRIQKFTAEYQAQGLNTIPKEIVPLLDTQTQARWLTGKTPLSRSTKFESEQAFNERIRALSVYDEGKAVSVPVFGEYNKINSNKLIKGLSSKVNMTEDMRKMLSKLNSAQIANFWKEYQKRAEKMGIEYSSDALMPEIFNDLQNSATREIILGKSLESVS